MSCFDCKFNATGLCSHPGMATQFAAKCSDFRKEEDHETYIEKEMEIRELMSKKIIVRLNEAVDAFENCPVEKLARWDDHKKTLTGRYTTDKYHYKEWSCLSCYGLYGLADETRFSGIHETWDSNLINEIMNIAKAHNIPILLLISNSDYKSKWWVSDEEEPRGLSTDYENILDTINQHRDLSISKLKICSVGEWLRSDEPFIGGKHSVTFVRNLDKIYLRIDMVMSERLYYKKFEVSGCSYVGCDEFGASMNNIYY